MTKNKVLYFLAFIAAVFLFLPQVGHYFNVRGYWWVCVMGRSYLFSMLSVPILIHLSFRYNILDLPDTRRVHSDPTPRIGGVAIFAAVYILTLNYWMLDKALLGICLASSIIFVMGLADDIKGLPSYVKLAGQILAASIVIYFGVSITFIPDTWFGSRVIEIGITIFWIIGVMNAINFLDGIDGLVTCLGIICAALFFILAYATYQRYVAYLCIILCSACLGFLPFNFKFWRKGRKGVIFLGDSGSTLIGFLLATIAIMGTWAVHNPIVALSTPMLILGVSIFDMIYTTVSRVKNGQVKTVREWLEYVGKDHFHHRLMQLGFSERRAVFFIVLITTVIGMSALIIPRAGGAGAVLLLAQAFCIFIMVVMLMLTGRRPSNL